MRAVGMAPSKGTHIFTPFKRGREKAEKDDAGSRKQLQTLTEPSLLADSML